MNVYGFVVVAQAVFRAFIGNGKKSKPPWTTKNRQTVFSRDL